MYTFLKSLAIDFPSKYLALNCLCSMLIQFRQFNHLQGLSLFSTFQFLFFFPFSFYLFIHLFLAALGLCCCAQAFSSCSERGLLFIAVRGLLFVVASVVVEHRLQARGLQQTWHVGSVVVARGLQNAAGSVVVVHDGLSCSAACGIFLNQGSNPCPLHWQADS